MYNVIWMPSAERNLATIWTEISNRSAVTSAMKIIDDELEKRPLKYGEARSGNGRIAFETPLAVIFEVNQPRRLVWVLRVFKYGNVSDV